MNKIEYQEHITKLMTSIIEKHDKGEIISPEWIVANLVADMVAENQCVYDLCVAIGIILPLRKKRFTFVTADEIMDRPDPKWLIEGLLIEKCFTIVYAQSKSFKSYLALNIMGHLATGGEFMPNVRLPKMGVVNIVLEGAFGMKSRLKAWSNKNNKKFPSETYRQIEDPLLFSDPQCVEELFEALRELKVSGFPLGFICIDTAAKALGAFDGMSQKDVIAFCAVCSRLVREFGVSVLLVHHTGKNEEGGIIGSNSWLAEPDCVWWISRPNKNKPQIILTVEKQKFGPDSQDHHFISETIEFDDVAFGAVTSDLVVVPDMSVATEQQKQRTEKIKTELWEIAMLVGAGNRKAISAVCLLSSQSNGSFKKNGRVQEHIRQLLLDERHVMVNGANHKLWMDENGKICCDLVVVT